ncbi:MAG: hypothetical protein P9E24_12700 [Candidatus Competibacter sp.]|nr:hypothetical protein [Candidatus Competibacter sp.]MDG4584820.1 hypothetical protein [Candidatus Competibacter sp.]
MNDKPDGARPDPDQLLTRIKAEVARSQRGKLKVFFSASAGIGNTYPLRVESHDCGML